MSTLSIQTQTPIAQLARSLFDAYDTNHDGQLGVDEFSTLVAKLTGAISETGSATTAATAGSYTSPVLSATATRTRLNGMEGFDHNKIADQNHRTVKYLFAREAQYVDLSGVKDKASAEALLRGMVPNLQAAGLQVLDVKGDKLKINFEGKEVWFDVIRGSSSGSPSFQWLPIES
jgi:hypothetical protein